jgi:MtN3 and saliva related transmembrane protein
VRLSRGGLNLSFTEYLGLIAGFLVTCSIIPQLVRVYKLKSAHDISLAFTGLLWLGMVIWLIYGISLKLVPIIIWNVAGVILIGLLVYAKLKYGK